MADVTLGQVIDYIRRMPLSEVSTCCRQLSALELLGLIRAFEADLDARATAARSSDSILAAREEQQLFTVNLTEIGKKKINLIKVVRESTGLGLKETKDLVESAPVAVKKDIRKDEAEALREKLREVGAEAEVT